MPVSAKTQSRSLVLGPSTACPKHVKPQHVHLFNRASQAWFTNGPIIKGGAHDHLRLTSSGAPDGSLRWSSWLNWYQSSNTELSSQGEKFCLHHHSGIMGLLPFKIPHKPQLFRFPCNAISLVPPSNHSNIRTAYKKTHSKFKSHPTLDLANCNMSITQLFFSFFPLISLDS